jgi:hypothetical protein
MVSFDVSSKNGKKKSFDVSTPLSAISGQKRKYGKKKKKKFYWCEFTYSYVGLLIKDGKIFFHHYQQRTAAYHLSIFQVHVEWSCLGGVEMCLIQLNKIK